MKLKYFSTYIEAEKFHTSFFCLPIIVNERGVFLKDCSSEKK